MSNSDLEESLNLNILEDTQKQAEVLIELLHLLSFRYNKNNFIDLDFLMHICVN